MQMEVNMEQLEMMYEGKAKKVYRTDDEDPAHRPITRMTLRRSTD